MTLIIILFSISIILAFGMIFLKAWKIQTNPNQTEENKINIPELPFRHLEKNMLYFIKHLLQGLVLILVRYWFIVLTKSKKWLNEKWPKITAYFKKNTEKVTSYRHSFVKKAILESRVKIKHIKEKVIKEIDNKEEDKSE